MIRVERSVSSTSSPSSSSSFSVSCVANQVVETTLDLALDYIYSNIIPDLDKLRENPLEVIDNFVPVHPIIEGRKQSGAESDDTHTDSSINPDPEVTATMSTGSDVNTPNSSNLKSVIVPTPRKRQPAKDGRKRSVQFAPEFIKDDDDDGPKTENTSTVNQEQSPISITISEPDIKEETNDAKEPEEEITRL